MPRGDGQALDLQEEQEGYDPEFVELGALKRRQQLNQELQEIKITSQYGKLGAKRVNTSGTTSVGGRWIKRCFLVKVTQSKLVRVLNSRIYNLFRERKLSQAYKSKKQNDVRYSRLSIRSWIIHDRKDET